jgi:hypothetical protein
MKTFYYDEKVEIWMRGSIDVPDDYPEEKLIEAAKSGYHVLVELLEKDLETSLSMDPMFETEDVLSPEENGGQCTISLSREDFVKEGNCTKVVEVTIYKNG